ncbi:Ferredoxin--NADP reductase [Pirellula sp. SH-Sr6A]|uniref:NAD(P)-binding domain-containing protein n=1 Tax=Pirellula sp. SH-Sr6A TaxID=1632865 RepID=UPI00078BB066|nr:NAD(P)-binding domain-containing protein [Pirellula sp. SH-Sr6A]AMV33572.1 Ferredoxin--NADP reductase [Pirellula sp. SH-Sr6A]
MSFPLQTDILLVGAGPIGIELAVALQRKGFDCVHIESGVVASTIAWYAPGTPIFSSPERIALAGIPFQTYPHGKATREDYLNYLRGVVLSEDLTIHQGQRLVTAQRSAEGFRCRIVESRTAVGGPSFRSLDEEHSGGVSVVSCRRIVLAIGDMHHPRQLGVAGEDRHNVSHFMPDIHELFGKRVVVVGAKNSAAEAVVRLARINRQLIVVHRGEGFSPERVKPWLLPEIRSLIADGRVEFLPYTDVKKIEPRTLQLQNRQTHRETSIPYEHLLLLTGYDQDPSLFQRLGLELDGENLKPKLDPLTMESSVPGVYVAGTATAGSQRGGVKVFIENCHVHVAKILAHLSGAAPASSLAIDRDEKHREL